VLIDDECASSGDDSRPASVASPRTEQGNPSNPSDPPSPVPSSSVLRKVLRSEAPARLTGRGRFRGFNRVHAGRPSGRMMRGLTRLLEERLFSEGILPSATRRRVSPKTKKGKGGRGRAGDPPSWYRGKGSGRRRGIAIDAQLSAIANGRKPAAKSLYHLTRVALTALKAQRIDLVCGQLPVVSDRANVASAVDVVGVREGNELVLVELKTGYGDGRLVSAMKGGMPQTMRAPLSRASDCLAHRHTTQLSATAAMFVSNAPLMARLEAMGIQRVTGTLLYVTDDDVETIELVEWWASRGRRILRALA